MLQKGILHIKTIEWPLMGSVKQLRELGELYFEWNVTQQETFTHCHQGMWFNSTRLSKMKMNPRITTGLLYHNISIQIK